MATHSERLASNLRFKHEAQMAFLRFKPSTETSRAKAPLTMRLFEKFRGLVMAVQNLSNRDFIRDVSAAKRAALNGPVFITEKGRPEYVLMKIDDYRMMVNDSTSLLEVMDNIPGGEGIDFSAPQLSIAVQEVDWN